MNKKTKLCKMCGLMLPNYYNSDWCWICWRNIWEQDHHRYYLNMEKDNKLWEEVQTIRGLFAFSEENKPIIKQAMVKEKEKLAKIFKS